MLRTVFLLSLRSIRRHVLRSLLTMLGIVIGVAAVVSMVTLGQATTAAVTEQIASLGSNILQVMPGGGIRRGGGGSRPSEFDYADVDAVREQVGGVVAIAPQATTTATAIYEGANWSTTITGTTTDYFDIQPWPLDAGRLFSAGEESAGKAVCIIGSTVRENLFRNVDPIGKRFRINDVSCDVVGLLSTKGQGGFGNDQDDAVIMPIKTVQRRFLGTTNVRTIVIGVDDAYSTDQVKATLKRVMRKQRHLTQNEDDDFHIFDTKQISDTLTQTTGMLTSIVAAIAAISLVVGGIGIMNIMLVSVTERTREIGIRLAVGAVANEVLMQFLVEAVVLSCIGGLIGLVLAQIVVAIAIPLMDLPWVFDLPINIGAFLVSAAIGVIFGYFPARRAASMNPIDALRYE
ncbi:ABC transporter permease [Novosphingobium mangrovi (ex Huang et al. 2023)]|uniref:ABC transporter permease n=1 Tax=Novosphingobium mangrovi (ex Huang et al. 2023) TaxID=2976432 RepID=A0ABT2I1Q2_9SPHN|nr:ABC transporter permease [Novosphingobium mangrovi (ex Huang et al. 2023)]MCT2398731.1 ABC transporter permease [Novosphingobium mangrovi (ex Huang et al. 2023)]